MIKKVSILLSCLLMFGCKPDKFVAEVYTSDIESGLAGEVIEIPVTISFSLLGDDDQGIFDKVKSATIRYVAPDTKFSKTKAMYGDKLVVETKIPLGSKEGLPEFLSANPRIMAVEVGSGSDHSIVQIVPTPLISGFINELQGINLMLGFQLPASKSEIRVVSDSKQDKMISAIAVFVSEKPHLEFTKTLSRRDSVELIFKGGDSVYSEITPQFKVRK